MYNVYASILYNKGRHWDVYLFEIVSICEIVIYYM